MPPHARPLSPHLQIYRKQIQMVSSLLHRATGIILFFGAVIAAAALVALASGPDAWACVTGLAATWYGQAVLLGWTWTLAYHWLNGTRHLLQDAGFGFSVARFVSNSWISVIGSLVITAGIWALVCSRGGVA